MMKKLTSLMVIALVGAACDRGSGLEDGGTGGGSGGGTGGGGGSGDSGVVTDAGIVDAGVVVTGECGLEANAAKRQALLDAQPVLEAKKKNILSVNAPFASVAGNASVMCDVELRFKDSNGNGTLDGYEDWRKTAAERAADLLTLMSDDQKLALMAHGVTTDGTTVTPSTATLAMISGNLRFASTAANNTAVNIRAGWANALQEKAEEAALGIPFVLSSTPVHSSGNGRVKARGFSQWPNEMGLAASESAALIEAFGKTVSAEYRAIGVRMAISPSADVATDPRWFNSQFTFGEDSAKVGDLVAAVVKGLQGGETLSKSSVAAVVGSFPGAGAAKGGFDARLAKGKFTTYPGNDIDGHIAPFQKAIAAHTAGVMTGYAIPEAGAWSGQDGVLAGATIEQVGASFNAKVVTDVLRTKLAFSGLVVAPLGAVNDAAVSPFGAPWGVEALSRAERIAKAVNAGVDQFMGVDDVVALTAAKSVASPITAAQISASAGRALALMFSLGLFEDPYVDAAAAPTQTNTDDAYRAGLDALNRGSVLIINNDKPAGWLNGTGDGSQSSDKGNAGNGTKKVLPAPPGEPYVAAGCRYFISGDFNLDYIRSVSAGYGELTNDVSKIGDVDVTTDLQKIALSDYVFIRIAAPFTTDLDSGALNIPTPLLTYAAAANADALAPIQAARAAISAWSGTPASQTQIVVAIDSGRLSVLDEVLAFNPAAVYVQWNGTNANNLSADKVFLDVAFGIANGVGKLPAGFPSSQAAADAQHPDVAGDGQHPTFVKGFGLTTPRFE